VIETVRKLGWSPDIVHCNDWITSFIPLYLKTTYKKDPLFKNTKTVFTIYNNAFTHKFKGDLMGKVRMIDIEDNMLGHLKTADYEGFIKLGAEFADVVNIAGDNKKLEGLVKKLEKKKIETYTKDDDHSESFFNLYTELVG
jgi:starch synthase